MSMAALLSCAPGSPPQPPPPPSPAPVVTPAPLANVAPLPPAIRPEEDEAAVRKEAQGWRAAHLLVDLHEHIAATPECLARAGDCEASWRVFHDAWRAEKSFDEPTLRTMFGNVVKRCGD